MVFPELQSTMNYAKVENAILSALSKLSLCFFVKVLLHPSKTNRHYSIFSYATQYNRDILISIHVHKVKLKIGYRTYR